jgi:hypothetical protein
MQMETLAFNEKILRATWHPRENTIAVRFVSSLRCGWTVDVHFYRLCRCNLILYSAAQRSSRSLSNRLFGCVVVVPSFVPLFHLPFGHCYLFL